MQFKCAVSAGIVTQCGQSKPHRGDGMEDVFLKVALCAFQKRCACFADTTAQNNGSRVKHSADIRKELAHIGIDLLQNFLGSHVFCVGGIKNIFDDQADAWLMISEEQVIERNPDYIVLITNMGSQGVEEILSRDGWGDINAIQNQKVFNDEDSCMARPSPRLKDAAIELFNFVNEIAAEEKPAA